MFGLSSNISTYLCLFLSLNSFVCSFQLTQSVLLSYVVYPPSESSTNEQCILNTQEFISRAVLSHPMLRFVFSFIGDTHTSIQDSLATFPDIRVNANVIDQGSDISNHLEAIRGDVKNAEIFMLLTCESRGPYIHKSIKGVPNAYWLEPFLSLLRIENLKAVGATISCELAPHIQSYAMAVDAIGVKVLLDAEAAIRMDSSKVSSLSAVDASSALLSKGYNIASLDSRYAGRDFRQRGAKCDPEFSGRIDPADLNPTVCRADSLTPGCRGVVPCEAIFVRLKDMATTPRITVSHLKHEDSQSTMCRDDPHPFAPYWDVPEILSTLIGSEENSPKFNKDVPVDFAVIIRAYYGNAKLLSSMLHFFSSLDKMPLSFKLIVIPTEKGSYEVINTHIGNFSAFAATPNVEISLLHVPDDFYSAYGSYLKRLCTKKRKRQMLDQGFTESNLPRFCNVNSPLHYLLCDTMIEFLKKTNCKNLVVTNADNYYSDQFFNFVVNADKSADIKLTNMIHKFRLYNTTTVRGMVDLGSFAVSVPFLRKTGINFLSSVPLRPSANHYHDADGHFIESLVAHGAKVTKTEDTLFTHN
jgi:hypothetical protein